MTLLHSIQIGNNPTTYLATFIAFSALIGSWYIMKYKQELSEKKDKEQDKNIEENRDQVNKAFRLFEKIGAEIMLLTETVKTLKSNLDVNTQNDKQKDCKIDELRKEIYSQISQNQDKVKGEIYHIREKTQELSERIAKIEK